MRVELTGIHRPRKRLANGKWREYHFIRGQKPAFWHSDMPIKLGSPAYFAAYERAVGIEPGVRKVPAGSSSDTLQHLIRLFQASDHWKNGLGERSRLDLSRGLKDIEEKWGHATYAVLNSPKFRNAFLSWIEANWEYKAADLRVNAAKRVLSWAVKARRILDVNALAGVPAYYEGSDRFRIIWHLDELNLFLDTASPALARAVALTAETAMRPGDLIRFAPKAHMQLSPEGARVIMFGANKSRRGNKAAKRTLQIPVTDRAAEIIDSTPSDQLLCLLSPKGRPWTVANLSHAVSDHLASIKLINGMGGRLGVKTKGAEKGKPEHLTLYDLRGTALTRLMRNGYSIVEAAAQMGWAPSFAKAMLDIYTAEDPSLADGMIVKLQSQAAG